MFGLSQAEYQNVNPKLVLFQNAPKLFFYNSWATNSKLLFHTFSLIFDYFHYFSFIVSSKIMFNECMMKMFKNV